MRTAIRYRLTIWTAPEMRHFEGAKRDARLPLPYDHDESWTYDDGDYCMDEAKMMATDAAEHRNVSVVVMDPARPDGGVRYTIYGKRFGEGVPIQSITVEWR